MGDSPPVCLAAKHHRNPQLLTRLLGPASETGMDQFRLYDICEVGTDRGANFLPTAGAIGVFRTGPIEPRCHGVPSPFHAAKTTAKGDVVTVGPQRLERGGAALCEFMFSGLKLCYECGPLGIGQPVVLHKSLPSRLRQYPWLGRKS